MISATVSKPTKRTMSWFLLAGRMQGVRRATRQQKLLLLTLPFLLGTVLLVVVPTLVTVGIAFTEYNAVEAPRWVGLGNFRRVFSSPLVINSFRYTLMFVGFAVPLRLLVAFALALLLQGKGRVPGVARAAVFIPTIIPEAAYALLWLWLFNPVYGPLNVALEAVGLPSPAWLVEGSSARMAIVIMSVFTMGEGFVVMLAALQNVSSSVYDAAKVDGANRWQQFRSITLPLMLPWLALLAFRDVIVSLQLSFTPSFILTYGGPYYETTFTPLLIYEFAFDFFDFGIAAALLVIMLIVTAILIVGVVNLVAIYRD